MPERNWIEILKISTAIHDTIAAWLLSKILFSKACVVNVMKDTLGQNQARKKEPL